MSETPVLEKFLTTLQASERGPHEPRVERKLSERDIARCLLKAQGDGWLKYAWLIQNYWSEYRPAPEIFEPDGTTEATLVSLLTGTAPELVSAPFRDENEDWRKYAWLLQWYWPKKYATHGDLAPNNIPLVGRPASEKT